MRTSRDERHRAEQISAAIDCLMHDQDARPDELDPADAELLDTARRLSRLPALLGPVDPVWEQRMMRRVQAGTGQKRRLNWARIGWATAGLAAMLLMVLLLTPLGQTAVASFVSVFSLGRTQVRITPVDTPSALSATVIPESTAVQRRLTLAEAQAQVPFAIPQPGYLPTGYRLHEVRSYTYPDLPAWLPQPFFVDLVYTADAGQECKLRLYPIMLGQEASISRLNLEAAPIQNVVDIDVSGQPGVLLQLGAEKSQSAWQEVVWEQGDLILALSATDLTEAELLQVARSVH
jgi:hypothetical protein